MPVSLAKKPKNPTALTWPDALDRFETHLRAAGRAPGTVEEYLRKLKQLAARVPVAPERVTVQHLREHVCGLFSGKAVATGKPWRACTVGTAVAAYRSFFGFLTDEDVIALDPTRRLETPRVPKELPNDVLSVAEVTRLLALPDKATPLGLRDRALVELLYATGLRRQEALSLTLADLDAQAREVRVVRGKGGKGRLVPVTRSAWAALQDYLDRGRPSLVTHRTDALAVFIGCRGERFTKAGILKLMRRLCAKARIKKHVTPHTLRRTFATHLLKNGVSLRQIQLLLGHARLDTTAVYLRLDTQELRREILLKHPRERLDA